MRQYLYYPDGPDERPDLVDDADIIEFRAWRFPGVNACPPGPRVKLPPPPKWSPSAWLRRNALVDDTDHRLRWDAPLMTDRAGRIIPWHHEPTPAPVTRTPQYRARRWAWRALFRRVEP